MWNGLTQDVRYAIRGFARSPLFVLVAVLSIGLGIGANAGMFSLFDQILLRPLPVRAPERLMLLDLPDSQIGFTRNDYAFSYQFYRELRDKNQAFEDLFASYNDACNVNYKGKSETVAVSMVTGNFFEALGLKPAQGRLLAPSDDVQRNGHPVVVLSHGYWQRRFGGDANVVGQTLRINAKVYQVVGVAPAAFRSLELDNTANVYVPLSQKSQITTTWDGMDDPTYFFLHVYGHRKPGVTTEQAKANLNSFVSNQIEKTIQTFPQISTRVRARMRATQFKLLPAGTPLLGDPERLKSAIVLMSAIVAVVLLIACANVANLLIARGSAREKEIAVRVSLGAGQGRLVRQVLVESLLLALMGGAVGFLLSIWIVDALLSLTPGDGFSELFVKAKPDWRIGVFCFTVSLLTGLLFGVAPAVRGAKKAIAESLKENTGGIVASLSQGLFRRGLVVAQVALSLVLLIAAGLFARSLMNLRGTNPGFRTDYLLTFRIDTSLNAYDKQRAVTFLDAFRKQVQAVPGVRDVTVASGPLLSDAVMQATMSIEGHTRRDGPNTNSRVNSVGPGFFRTMGFPVLSGREFSETDQVNSKRVAVVNEVFAKDFFDGNAIGKRIGFGYGKNGAPNLDLEIVGVIRDGKYANLREQKPSRFVYTPYSQDRDIEGMTFYVRSQRDPDQLVGDLRAALRNMDDNLAMYRIQSMERTMDQSLTLERRVAFVCSSFGLLATLLAAIGLYGVMAFNVARRTREIGIRMALGAERTTVIAMVMREAGWMLGAGLAVGLPVALALGRFVESQLWGLKPGDPIVLAGASLVLTLVAALAGLVPALRASRSQPVQALRYE